MPKKTTEQGSCPVCGSRLVSYPKQPADFSPVVIRHGRCDVCGCPFIERFALKFVKTEVAHERDTVC